MPYNRDHIDTWSALRNGEKRSLQDIYNQHYIGLLNFGIKLTRQRDITRDCIFQLLLRLWENHQKLPAVENVRSYLLTSLQRELIAHIKTNRVREINNQKWDQLYPGQELSYEECLIQTQQGEELKNRISQALMKLSAREKELLQLKFFEDLDYDTIAGKCNITKRTAYNIVHGALKTLKSTLSAKQGKKLPEPALIHLIFLVLSGIQ
ncbi:MAG: sigma-70 family RNA polymerase sigma factor [Chitinophagaceae bacterium]|nr:sigma-70 family RNA polymerase sigma factor [Chitinophagaceae bacterium]MCW5927684.1 sigma-70 family RNA polymerase sigma factor [Chitinophagaceae bacterium]